MKRRLLLCLSTLVGVVMSLAACQSETNPIASDSRESGAAIVTMNGVNLFRTPPSLSLSGSTVVEISPTLGGNAGLDRATLSVPAGAVAAATSITMRPDPQFQGYVFGPSGLRFSTPATLTIRVNAGALRASGVDPARLRIAGASDGADDWSVIGGAYDPRTGTVSALIHHFSRYALCID